MNTAMSQERLSQVIDEVTCEITRQAAGIDLVPCRAGPTGELYTVFISFVKGFHTSLSLCAHLPLYVRLAQGMMMTQAVTAQDVEAVAKEYFNVLCGHIAARMFSASGVPARFSVPAFYKGRFEPENCQRHIVRTYSLDGKESVQLTHFVPCENTPAAVNQ